MELHTICQAFVQDVEDKERTSFSADFVTHYYKLYAPAGLTFYPGIFGCKKMDEIVDLIPDTIKLDNNMLLPVLDLDASFDDFVQKAEDARQERVDRIGAGDEGAQLKFKAQRLGAKGPKGGYKGGNFQNFKGQQRGGKGNMPMPQQQRAPVTYNAAPKGNFGKGGGYAMRTIPAGMKRIDPGMVQSEPKRFR
jgi:hypothetical protein